MEADTYLGSKMAGDTNLEQVIENMADSYLHHTLFHLPDSQNIVSIYHRP